SMILVDVPSHSAVTVPFGLFDWLGPLSHENRGELASTVRKQSGHFPARLPRKAAFHRRQQMSLRTFVDSSRREWLAFDAIPRANERRNPDRRNDDEPEFTGQERRDTDRRLTVGGSGTMQGTEGWLCFESGEDRRRLSPIPHGWTRA